MEIDYGFDIPKTSLPLILDALKRRGGSRETMTTDQLLHSLSRDELAAALAHIEKIPYLPGCVAMRDPELMGSLDVAMLRRGLLVPLQETEMRLTVAIANPYSLEGINYCRQAFPKREIVCVMASLSEIEAAIGAEMVSGLQQASDDAGKLDDIQIDSRISVLDLGAEQKDPVMSVIVTMFKDALIEKASDIHLWIEQEKFVYTTRCNGSIVEKQYLDSKLGRRVDGVLMTFLKLDRQDANRGIPQDGRMTLINDTGRRIHVRYSRTPAYPESSFHITLRILDKLDFQPVLGQDTLNFPRPELVALTQSLNMSDGLVILSGPTGSGKSTTLVACLKQIATPEKITLTLENPVEEEIPGVIHAQIDKDDQFKPFIRSFMRSDPDKIMVGEVRDRETAAAALDLAITGHLVLSTIHATSAADILSRCKQMGVPIHDLVRVLRLLAAQRLPKVLCPHCADSGVLDAKLVEAYRISPEHVGKEIKFRRVGGCSKCKNRGYIRRKALIEMLPFNGEIAEFAGRPECTPLRLETMVREKFPGLKSLKDHGLDMVFSGETDIAAIAEVINIGF